MKFDPRTNLQLQKKIENQNFSYKGGPKNEAKIPKKQFLQFFTQFWPRGGLKTFSLPGCCSPYSITPVMVYGLLKSSI